MSLLAATDLAVCHIGSLEEVCFRRARHQAGDSNSRILKFIAERYGERVEEGFGSVVNRLESPRHQTCNRTRDEYATLTSSPHAVGNLVDQTYSAIDIRVNYLQG